MCEDSYDKGARAANTAIIAHCCRSLGYDDVEASKVSWIGEREALISALRDVCADHGDNDWDGSLHLADVVNKHLLPYLEEAKG